MIFAHQFIHFLFSPLTPLSDHNRISPYNTVKYNTKSSRQVMRITRNNNLQIISWFITKFPKITSSKLHSRESITKWDFWSERVNWKAQSKNDPLIFRPLIFQSTCQNSTTSEHFQKWPKNQGIVLALSLSIEMIIITIPIQCACI